jgi:radical SAM protein with 4Fe4S-binding SPASM domain
MRSSTNTMDGRVLTGVVEMADQQHVPLEVLFEVTHRCNLPCEHCYLELAKSSHGELTLGEIEHIFGQLAAAGTMVLTMTGGEPFARKDFLDIVALADGAGFAIKILTNATRITDEIAATLAGMNVLEVSVSVYGASADIHDAVTALPGSYRRTMAGVEALRAHGIWVGIKTPLMTLNGDAARSVHDLARAHGIPCRFDVTMKPKVNGDLRPLELQLERRRIVRVLKQEPFRSLYATMPMDDGQPAPCAAGRSYCSIGPTGDVQPCVMMPRPVGNLREQSFAEIWAGAHLFERLRALTPSDLVCATCDVKGACSRCPGVAVQRGADIDGCDQAARVVASARLEARRQLTIEAQAVHGECE